MLNKVISGGQTGVDMAALDAAMAAGLEVGGSCPKGRRSEAGPIPLHYPLQELSSSDYLTRTIQNVVDSDGTLILTFGPPTGGTEATIQYAAKYKKAHAIYELTSSPLTEEAVHWVLENGIRTLNVAGPRGSHHPRVYSEAYAFLDKLFDRILS